MSNLQFYAYPGLGEWAQKNLSYSQAVRVDDRIICSGQGGWDCRQTEPSMTNLIKDDLLQEIDQAFDNVDYNLKHAGGQGWSQVYKVVTYSTDIPSQHDRILKNFRDRMPDHCPIWTEIGVKQLGSDSMHFEIEVEAYDAEGAVQARKAKASAGVVGAKTER